MQMKHFYSIANSNEFNVTREITLMKCFQIGVNALFDLKTHGFGFSLQTKIDFCHPISFVA